MPLICYYTNTLIPENLLRVKKSDESCVIRKNSYIYVKIIHT